MSQPPARLSYKHEAIVDLILQAPTVTQTELCEIFDLSTTTINNLVNSDAFVARIDARKSQLIDPIIMQRLNDRVQSITLKSMAIIEKKLLDNPTPAYAMKVLEMVNKSKKV